MTEKLSGMLWFDNNTKTTLEDKINSAVLYFNKKYNTRAKVIFVSPDTVSDLDIPEIKIIQSRSILKNHLLVSDDAL